MNHSLFTLTLYLKSLVKMKYDDLNENEEKLVLIVLVKYKYTKGTTYAIHYKCALFLFCEFE